MRLLVAAKICDVVGLADLCVTSETIWLSAASVHARSYGLNLQLKLTNTLGIVFNSIQFLALHIGVSSTVLFGRVASWPARRQLVGILQVLRKNLLQFPNCVFVLRDEVWEILDVSRNHSSGER